MNESDDNTTRAGEGGIECRSTKEPAVKIFIAAAMFLGYGVYCLVDTVPPPQSWTMSHINPAIEYILHIGGPWFFGALGLLFILWAVSILRRRLVADDSQIGYVGKEAVAWNSVTRLDATRLKTKGIMIIHYKKPDSEEGTLKLDGWYLGNFRDLVALVEKNVPENLRDIR
jgi:hypothetical protein